MSIRAVKKGDRVGLEDIVRRAGNFSDEEVATAMELIDEAVLEKNEGDYIVYILEEDGALRGYVSIGPTPLASGVYDLYWIAVDSSAHRKGYGKSLLAFAEDEVRRRGGRMVLIETSSRDEYRATREFYIRTAYDEVARIPDFYDDGDDKIVYAKRV